MAKNKISMVSIFLILVILISCAPREAKITAVTETPKLVVPEIRAKEKWQEKWEKVVSEAKKEGKVVVQLSAAFTPIREELKKEIKSKYGIEPEWITGRATEMAEKAIREHKAGIYNVDIYMSGPTTPLTSIKPAGLLQPIEPILILPEVTNPKAWWEEKLNFIDKDKLILSFFAAVEKGLVYNADHVSKEDLQSYRDLLNPRWKGKIVMSDPTIGGAGSNWFSAIGLGVMGEEYLKELAKQELMFTRDVRLMLEWLARGKYPIAIGISPMWIEFQKAGVPLYSHTPKEGYYLSSSGGNIALYKNAPHPNAASVFINWILSREGQTFLSKGIDVQSARIDVPTDFLSEIRQPAKSYFDIRTEESILQMPENFKIAREIFNIK